MRQELQQQQRVMTLGDLRHGVTTEWSGNMILHIKSMEPFDVIPVGRVMVCKNTNCHAKYDAVWALQNYPLKNENGARWRLGRNSQIEFMKCKKCGDVLMERQPSVMLKGRITGQTIQLSKFTEEQTWLSLYPGAPRFPFRPPKLHFLFEYLEMTGCHCGRCENDRRIAAENAKLRKLPRHSTRLIKSSTALVDKTDPTGPKWSWRDVDQASLVRTR
jgi:hypothetical protein